MAKFMEEVDGRGGLSRTEHALRSVLCGDIETARVSLTRALERLGYNIISEDPLYARRSARGWAVYYCSFDILAYPRKLRIGLKPLGPNATLATFDYAVEHFGAFSSRGDRQTLKLEAEAIIALASQSATVTMCTACGTNQPDDARFCRVCGAPNVGGEPAELELLRLAAGARAGHHLITATVIWAIAPLIAAVLGMMFFGSGGTRLAAGLLLAMLGNLIILFVVLNHSRKTLNPDLSHKESRPANPSELDATKGPAALFAAPESFEQKYVTEGTTELLTPNLIEREKELVPRKGRDTSPTG